MSIRNRGGEDLVESCQEAHRAAQEVMGFLAWHLSIRRGGFASKFGYLEGSRMLSFRNPGNRPYGMRRSFVCIAIS